MKYLFVHQNFLGQYLHFIRHLVNESDNDIIFISQPTQQKVEGVRSVFYNMPPKTSNMIPALTEIESAYKRGIEVFKAATIIKKLGFKPDIIIGHQGWGELLNIHDVYPDVPILKYCEFYYHTKGLDVNFDPEFISDELLPARVRIKNFVNLISANDPGWGQTPTEFQYSTYPEWMHNKMTILREGVDLEKCKPEPQVKKEILKIDEFEVHPHEKLVTYIARGLEPYRGFHILMRALPIILKERSDTKILIVGRDQVSYGAALQGGISWREFMLKKLQDQLDLSRIYFPGQVTYPVFRRILKRSDAHIYMTYPFVLSWSLREAMATGCSIIASDTQPIKEFIQDGVTGLLTPFFDKEKLAENVLTVLENKLLAQNLGNEVRKAAENHLSMKTYLAQYKILVQRLIKGETPPTHLGTSPNPL